MALLISDCDSGIIKHFGQWKSDFPMEYLHQTSLEVPLVQKSVQLNEF